jgi:hypothetical protein
LKTIKKYLFFFFIPCSLFPQVQQSDLSFQNANACLFSGNLYAFGIRDAGAKKSALAIYRLTANLSVKDSFVHDLGNIAASQFLQLSSDTLYGFLNIYLQKKEKKLVQIFRFNKDFKPVATVDDVDIARLNSISAFEKEIFYYKNFAYTVKSVSDTSGKQFYLNKYGLKSDQKNFEYELKWQFPFERKNIHSAHIVFVNEKLVLLYVNIIEGHKKGQWLLSVNNASGTLRRGSKLNDAMNGFYSLGAVMQDSASLNVFITGQKFSDAEADQKENKFTAAKASANIYLNVIDTAGEIIERNEFKLPVTEQKSMAQKEPSKFILRNKEFSQDKEQNIVLMYDVYKGIGNSMCYSFCNTLNLKIKFTDGRRIAEKAQLSSNPLIEKYYFNADQLDMNGKACLDSLDELETLFYKNIALNVNLGFKTDEMKNPIWLLKKSDAKKGIDNYTVLAPVKKVYQLTKITEVNKNENPGFILLSPKQFLISRQSSPDKFQLQVFNW